MVHYEYIFFTTRQGWIQHAQSVSSLVEMRGPERFQEVPEKAILEINKLVLVAQSLNARKRCFLENNEWQTIRLADPSCQGYMTSLGNTFTKLPGIVEAIEGFASGNVDVEQATDGRDITTVKLSNLFQELDEWCTRLTHALGHVSIEVAAEQENGISSDVEGPVVSTLLEFSCLEVANAFTNHHAIKIAALE